VIDHSTKLVVMTEHGAQMLREIYGVADGKIAVILHGIPDVAFEDPNFYKDQFGAGCWRAEIHPEPSGHGGRTYFFDHFPFGRGGC